MLYMQYLRDGGDDIQAAYVIRRNLITGDVDGDESTAAIKYHGFAGELEYDVLLAQSYGDSVLGFGGSKNVGGSVWTADAVITRTDNDTVAQVTTNLTYSWNWFDRNMSGAIEYFFNADCRWHQF